MLLTDEEQIELLKSDPRHFQRLTPEMVAELRAYIEKEMTTGKLSPHVVNALKNSGVLHKLAQQEQETIGLKKKVKEHDGFISGLAKKMTESFGGLIHLDEKLSGRK